VGKLCVSSYRYQYALWKSEIGAFLWYTRLLFYVLFCKQCCGSPWHFGTDPDLVPRIRTPLTNRSGSCSFLQYPWRWQLKFIFLLKFFCLLLLIATFTSFFKEKKVAKQQELLFLLDNRRIRSRIRISYYWIRIWIQEAQKHTDPTDPDPQHWFQGAVS
jgi:hypothetical protein